MKTKIKLLYTALLVYAINVTVFCQETNQKSYDLYLVTGLKYSGVAGPAMGLMIYSPDKKLSFDLRYDIGFSIGAFQIYNPNQSNTIPLYSNHYSIVRYDVRTYINTYYRVIEKKQNKLDCGVGLGWIYNGNDEKYILNDWSGYYTLSLSATYKISWFLVEPRFDIPLANWTLVARKFPASISLLYRFKPKLQD